MIERSIDIRPSPWAERSNTLVHVREAGNGSPILLLHGGWGHEAFPFDHVVHELVERGYRCIIPSRTGYGKSTPLERQPLDFHQRAANETQQLLDALHIEQPILWGHSDGAVIAAWLMIQHPTRFRHAILESFHAWPDKRASRTFFESAAKGTLALPTPMVASLKQDHGDRWQNVIRMNGQVWVDLANESPDPHDLYAGALSTITGRTLLFYGDQDPRMEPGEMDWAHAAIPRSAFLKVPGRHAPHLPGQGWERARERVLRFLDNSDIAPR